MWMNGPDCNAAPSPPDPHAPPMQQINGANVVSKIHHCNGLNRGGIILGSVYYNKHKDYNMGICCWAEPACVATPEEEGGCKKTFSGGKVIPAEIDLTT